MIKLIYGLMEQQKERERLKEKLATELHALQEQLVSPIQKFILDGRANELHGLTDCKEEAVGGTKLFKFTLNGIPVLVVCPPSIYYWDGSPGEYPPCKREWPNGVGAHTRGEATHDGRRPPLQQEHPSGKMEGHNRCPLAGKLFVYLGTDIADDHWPAFESVVLINADGELFTSQETDDSSWVYQKNAGETAAMNVIKYCFGTTVAWVGKPNFRAQKQGLLAKVNLMGHDEIIAAIPQPAIERPAQTK